MNSKGNIKQIFTYVIWMKDGEHFKIGKTKNLQSRIRQHRGSNPFICKVAVFNGDYENYLMRCCKMVFDSKGREWFVGLDIESTASYLSLCMQRLEKTSNECEAVYFLYEELEKFKFKQGINETE